MIVSLTALCSLKADITSVDTIVTAILFLLSFFKRCSIVVMMRGSLVGSRCSNLAFWGETFVRSKLYQKQHTLIPDSMAHSVLNER